MIGKTSPAFKTTMVAPDGTFKDITEAAFKGKHTLLFFYPLDFTFVCPSEIVAFDQKIEEFTQRGVQVFGCSVDSQFCHWAWRNTPREKGGIGPIRFPLIADIGGKIASDFGVLNEGGVAYRGTFLMDKEGIVRHMLVNDLGIGRSVDEAMRCVDALQFTEKHGGEVCPANWKKGDKAMKASHDGVAEYMGTTKK